MFGFNSYHFSIFLTLFLIVIQLGAQDQPPENINKLNDKLIDASYEGNNELVLKLLERGADPNTSGWNGITPLMYAVDNEHLETVKILVLNGADVNLKPENGISALISAVMHNNIEISEYLIRHGADIEIKDNIGNTSLIYAAAYNYFDLCDMLIYYQCNLETQNNNGVNALMSATYAGNYDLSGLLLKNGSIVNQADKEGFTALMFAGQNGDTSLLNLLIENNADPGLENIYGLSALHLAIENGHVEAAKLLIESGSKTELPENSKFTVNKLADYSNSKEMKRYLSTLGIKRKFKPAIDILLISTELKFNYNDLYFGGKIGFIDKNLNAGLNLGFYRRLFPVRIYVISENNNFYQYWEKRSSIEMGINKFLHLANLSTGATIDLYASGKFLYSFGGNYPGSEKAAKSVTKIVPGFGIYWGKELFKFKLGYEFCNLGIQTINSNWITFGAYLNINMHKKEFENRTFEWY